MEGLGEHGRAARGRSTDSLEYGQGGIAEEGRDDGGLRLARLGFGAAASAGSSSAIHHPRTAVV
jgi:hypothetical protein